jgi:hypothetical protein
MHHGDSVTLATAVAPATRHPDELALVELHQESWGAPQFVIKDFQPIDRSGVGDHLPGRQVDEQAETGGHQSPNPQGYRGGVQVKPKPGQGQATLPGHARNRYPVLKIHQIAVRQTAMKASVAVILTPTPTSDTP